MKIALSPCPNDTYLFHAWIAGLCGEPPEVFFADIQTLNELALSGLFPLIKLSFGCFKRVVNHYQLLPIGSALGFNCGPKIISKTHFSVEKLSEMRVAIPGKDTTAHLLLNHLLPPPKEKKYCLYHEVAQLIDKNEVDCGLIIHETRFTFAAKGFIEIIDLGELWQDRYQLPLPLGGLAIHKDFPNKEEVVSLIEKSLDQANTHPDLSRNFILKYSQEKNPEIVDRHIETYVNEETKRISRNGILAIETLTNLCLKDLLFLPKRGKLKPAYPC